MSVGHHESQPFHGLALTRCLPSIGPGVQVIPHPKAWHKVGIYGAWHTVGVQGLALSCSVTIAKVELQWDRSPFLGNLLVFP